MSDLLHCCGSHKWATAMNAALPFTDADAMLRTSDEICAQLERSDWLEAFGAHPKIGERATSQWSKQEQAGASSASAHDIAELESLNRAYEARFGYIFIICATGKTTEQFLDALRERLRNPQEVEIGIAAQQQRQITRLRLLKLITETP